MRLGPNFIHELTRILNSMKTSQVSQIILSKNQIEDQGLKHLVQVINTARIVHLNL